MTRPKIERWVTRIDAKLARLTEDREFWTEQIQKPTTQGAESAEPDRDSTMEKDSLRIRTGPEVHAMMAKLRSERTAKRG